MRLVFVRLLEEIEDTKKHFEINLPLALKNINYKASIIGILMMLALKKINYKASIRTIRKCLKMDGQKYIPNTTKLALLVF